MGNQFKLFSEYDYGITPKIYEKNLKSAFELSDNVYLVFSNTYDKQFTGYAKMITDYFDGHDEMKTIKEECSLKEEDFETNFIFKIEWKSRNQLKYFHAYHLKNSFND